MRVLILGRSGQLARALVDTKPDWVEVIAWGRDELDLLQAERIVPALSKLKPDAIINASAYTAVDKAETDVDTAEKLNVDAVAAVASAAAALDGPLVHVSTDFVFDGAASKPYLPSDECRPLGVYGATKRRGEQAVLERYPSAAIVRTAWVYRAGAANFMSTMLRLMAERDELGVVADQIGAPTSADNLAYVLWGALDNRLSGIWHYSDAGVASWYDFACAIYRQARQIGVLSNDVVLKPLVTAEYPTPAIRPSYSVLDSRALREALEWPAIHWQDALAKQLLKLQQD